MYLPPEFGQNPPTFTTNYADDKHPNKQTELLTIRVTDFGDPTGAFWVSEKAELLHADGH